MQTVPQPLPTSPGGGLFPLLGQWNGQNIPILGTFIPMLGGQQNGQNPQNPGGILGNWGVNLGGLGGIIPGQSNQQPASGGNWGNLGGILSISRQ